MSLTAKAVSLTLSARPVLVDVSLEVAPGRVTALLGPNGAGKSSLLGVLAGTLSPEKGAVTLDDVGVASLSRVEVAKKVAVVAQDLAPSSAFTAREIVALGRAPHQGRWMLSSARDERVIADAMNRLGISALASRAVASLSGGERRRVALARALAQDAPYLLLDEPAANLDLEGEARLFEVARAEATAGRGVLVVLHGLEGAARLADAVVLMNEGRVVGAGDARDVLTQETVTRTFGVEVDVAASPLDGGLHVLPKAYRR